MSIKKSIQICAGLLLATAMSTQAWGADCRKKTELVATPTGMSMDSSGHAEVRARGQRQKFKVSMDARVADGVSFVVKANGRIIDVIRVEFGDGELELDNGDGAVIPVELGDVCTVGMVTVEDGSGNVILQGNF